MPRALFCVCVPCFVCRRRRWRTSCVCRYFFVEKKIDILFQKSSSFWLCHFFVVVVFCKTFLSTHDCSFDWIKLDVSFGTCHDGLFWVNWVMFVERVVQSNTINQSINLANSSIVLLPIWLAQQQQQQATVNHVSQWLRLLHKYLHSYKWCRSSTVFLGVNNMIKIIICRHCN